MRLNDLKNSKISIILKIVIVSACGYISLACNPIQEKQNKESFKFIGNYSSFKSELTAFNSAHFSSPYEQLPNSIDLSFCDRLKLAINDIPSDFRLFKGKSIFEDDEKILFESKYLFDQNSAEIYYDKISKNYTLNIETFNGLNVDDANLIFERDREIIISCLPNYIHSELKQVKLTENLLYTLQNFSNDSYHVGSVVYQTVENHKYYGKTVRFRVVIEISYRF